MMKMNTISTLKLELRAICEEIQETMGVENVVIVERNGYPLVSAGVWLSRDEIFEVSASAAAINASMHQYNCDMRYALFEGESYKVSLFNIPEMNEFFLIMTMSSKVNLGAAIIKATKRLGEIRNRLKEILLTATAPLIEYTKDELREIEKGFQVKYTSKSKNFDIYKSDLYLDESTIHALNKIVSNLKTSLGPVLENIALTTLGGFVIISNSNESYGNILMSAVFDAAKKLLGTLRDVEMEQLMLVYPSNYFIMQSINNIVLQLKVTKEIKLGLLRFIINATKKSIKEVLKRAISQPSTSVKVLSANVNALLRDLL